MYPHFPLQCLHVILHGFPVVSAELVHHREDGILKNYQFYFLRYEDPEIRGAILNFSIKLTARTTFTARLKGLLLNMFKIVWKRTFVLASTFCTSGSVEK